MNLTERAEISKETYYKLTNSRDIPEAPKVGGRNYLRGTSDEYQTYTNTNYILGYPSTYRDWNKLLDPLRGKTVTLRAYIKNDTNYPVRIQMWFTGGGVYGNTVAPHSEGWSVKTGKMSADWTSANVAFVQTDGTATGGTIQAKEAKVEVSESATPYSQAPEDYGWSTTAPVPTSAQRYLWKFEYIYYSDGSVEVTQPTNISVAGVNGQTSHVHFAFADNATGGGFSLTTPKAYMGWYADFNESASNDPTKYRWSKWKGDQGAPGKPGADGKTSYFHMAYAESADGRTGFSFKESGQQYQGYYTDFTQTSSTDPTKYTWMDRRAGVEVGGVNLYALSKNSPLASNNITNFKQDVKTGEITFKVAGRDPYFGVQANKNEGVGTIRGVKIPVKTGQDIAVQLTNGLFIKNYVSYFDGNDKAIKNFKGYQSNKFTVPASELEGVSYVTFRFGIKEETQEIGSVHTTKVKVEYGNVYTGWTPALEDTQADIDSKADQTLTQEQLNALEAKRLQMETEMKALATLQQVSELEMFINNLKKEDLDGRQKIIEITKAIEERVKDIEPIMEYSQKLKFMDTYITQGNGGMVIGANESTTKVVVTPDRISFQSGGSEVAYISQRMLHIDNGVFTMSLQLGHYITRAHPKNEYVNATYFVK